MKNTRPESVHPVSRLMVLAVATLVIVGVACSTDGDSSARTAESLRSGSQTSVLESPAAVPLESAPLAEGLVALVTFEQAIECEGCADTFGSFVAIGTVKGLEGPFWNTKTGGPWNEDPGPVGEVGNTGFAASPVQFQVLTVEVETWIRGSKERTASKELQITHSTAFGVTLSDIMVGKRVLAVGSLGDVEFKDGHVERLDVFTPYSSYVEIQPGVAAVIADPIEGEDLDTRVAKLVAEQITPEGLVSDTMVLLQWDRLVDRAVNVDKSLENQLGYQEIYAEPPAIDIDPETLTEP